MHKALRGLALVLAVAALFVAQVAPASAAGQNPGSGPADAGSGAAAGPDTARSGSPEAAPAISIYYAGPPEGSVVDALLVAGTRMVSDPGQAQVIVLNDEAPDPAGLAERVRAGAGLVLILGPHLGPTDVEPFLGSPDELTFKDNPLTLEGTRSLRGSVVSGIEWNSAPQVHERYVLAGTKLSPLVAGYGTGEIVLGQATLGRGKIFVFTPFLAAEANFQIRQWAYFNYLVYALVSSSAGTPPLSFGAYPGSPVPHAAERNVLVAVMAALVAAAFIAFFFVRRWSLAHPEALNALVIDRTSYAQREADTDWENVGFHRPLGGFMLALMLGLVLFIPLIVYQNLLLPVYILPSAQALGIWDRVVQFFNVAWLFFDMGTSTAFVKFLSQYRVDDPRKGIQFGQLFVWWQALSGSIQVTLVVILASTLLPGTAYALYAWSIILHSLVQVPGFYQVYRHTLYGLQRFDYAQALEIGAGALFPMLTQPLIVILMYSWGRSHLVFGPPMAGLLGMGIAAYAAEALTFVTGWWLYRRLGYSTQLLFLAHFDWDVIKTAFRFGIFDMLGSLAWGIGQAAEVWITQARLLNYAEIWGNWRLAQNFIYAFQVLQTLYNNLMPAISEAISHAKVALSQYYEAQAYKWGGLVSAFVASVLLAVADRFILGASGPEFHRAAAYAVPLILWGAIQYPSWVGDNVQRAANKPYLITLLIGGEQLIRLVLAWLLLSRFQINALIIAYFVGLLTKDFAAYILNHRICFPQRFYFWQSLAAPLLAGLAHYGVIRVLAGLIWRGDQVTSVVIFFIGILPSYPLYAFFYGLFGGWDDETLAELHRAVPLSGFTRPLAWLFWWATAQGARLSPLHNRFPISIRRAALREAETLTVQKVEL